jgi:hypothetical protein
MHERLSRCWTCLNERDGTSDHRRPQATPRRLHDPAGLSCSDVGRVQQPLGLSDRDQFPTRGPLTRTRLTRMMPAASSGDSSLCCLPPRPPVSGRGDAAR